jgi:hypothetical protein
MNSLAQSTSTTGRAAPRSGRIAGGLAILSGIALVLLSQQMYLPSSFDLLFFLFTLVYLLGLIPAIQWMARRLAAHDTVNGSRGAEFVGLAGVAVAVATAALALPRWLSPVPAQILTTSALGVIGLWFVLANGASFRTRLINRALAVIGVLGGLAWLVVAIVMWIELVSGDLGGLTQALEGIRSIGDYVALAMYLIWALWLGIWLLVRKR